MLHAGGIARKRLKVMIVLLTVDRRLFWLSVGLSTRVGFSHGPIRRAECCLSLPIFDFSFSILFSRTVTFYSSFTHATYIIVKSDPKQLDVFNTASQKTTASCPKNVEYPRFRSRHAVIQY